KVSVAARRVLYEKAVLKLRFFAASTSSPQVVRLILANRSLAPMVTSEADARLLPRTSFDVVTLAPACSISRLCPAKIISLDFRSKSHLPERPYLNLSSLKP